MKPAIIALMSISCGIAAGVPNDSRQTRVSIQFIEVPHSELTEMLAGTETNGRALHAKAEALCKQGQAKILETCMMVCRSRRKAVAESIREEIYPTEYAPPGLPCGFTSGRDPLAPPMNPKFRSPTAFDTRNTGTSLEVTADFTDKGLIELQLNLEMTSRLRLETSMEHIDQWGDGSVRMPIFERSRFNSSITVKPGSFELISTLTPKTRTPAPAPALSKKIFVFARADLLAAP